METGSISIAAQKLFVTQPAVTKRIHNLEDYLGIKLFDSVGRGIQPNQTAHQILPRVKQWLYELEDIQRGASQAHYHIQGKLKIGTSHHIGLHHLPKYLKPFAQDYPLVELEVQFVDSEHAHELVLSGDIELAFLTLPPQPDARLHYQLLWEDPLYFVAAPFHPLAQQNTIKFQDLTRYPSLLPAAHTYTSQITLAEFEKHRLKPKISMSTNPLESIRMLVSIGLGWSVLPNTLINQDLQILTIDVHLQRQLGMVWHPERSQSKAMQTLLQSILRSSG